MATVKDLAAADEKARQAERKFQLDVDRLEASNRNAAAGQRLTQRGQDITRRGQDLADRRAREKAASGGKRKGDRGALSAHQKIIGGIQDAESVARQMRRKGLSQDLAVRSISSPRSKDNPRSGPSGAFGSFTTRAAVSLAYNGYIKPHLLGGLRERGLLLHRTPAQWKRAPRRKPVVQHVFPFLR